MLRRHEIDDSDPSRVAVSIPLSYYLNKGMRKPPTATNSQRSRGEGVRMIIETEYGYLYNDVLYATFTEAEHAKADS